MTVIPFEKVGTSEGRVKTFYRLCEKQDDSRKLMDNEGLKVLRDT